MIFQWEDEGQEETYSGANQSKRMRNSNTWGQWFRVMRIYIHMLPIELGRLGEMEADQ